MGSLLGDEIYIEGKDCTRVGPVKASVQGSKIFVFDTSLIIEEGGRIFRTLPNGKSEVHKILEYDFLKDPMSGKLSHYEIHTKKEGSLTEMPGSKTTINISHSKAIQIGDQNVQNIVDSFEVLFEAIESAEAPEEEKMVAKAKLKALLSNPLINTIIGVAAKTLVERLGAS